MTSRSAKQLWGCHAGGNGGEGGFGKGGVVAMESVEVGETIDNNNKKKMETSGRAPKEPTNKIEKEEHCHEYFFFPSLEEEPTFVLELKNPTCSQIFCSFSFLPFLICKWQRRSSDLVPKCFFFFYLQLKKSF